MPLEDLGVLILDSYGITYAHELMSACAERNIAVVFCDAKHLPVAMLVPFSGHSTSTEVLREQIGSSEPAKKQVWKQIVQAKIREQAKHLIERNGANGKGVRRLLSLVETVKSGDPENVEGQAAQIYFDALLDGGFTRDRTRPGLNAFLNYGYAVARACAARAIVGAGLHPSLGVHHRNRYNPFCLADDAMEPLRPMVDRIAIAAWETTGRPDELSPAAKKPLLELTGLPVKIAGKPFPLIAGMHLYAASLKRALCSPARKVSIPET